MSQATLVQREFWLAGDESTVTAMLGELQGMAGRYNGTNPVKQDMKSSDKLLALGIKEQGYAAGYRCDFSSAEDATGFAGAALGLVRTAEKTPNFRYRIFDPNDPAGPVG